MSLLSQRIVVVTCGSFSKFLAACAVAFGLPRLTICSAFCYVTAFSVSATFASTSLAMRSVSTDDAAPTSPLRPCNV